MPRLLTNSEKLSTMMSWCGLGFGSGGPSNPHSSGRRTNAVLKPTFFAASRSKLWHATIKHSLDSRLSSLAVVVYASGNTLYLPKISHESMASHFKPFALAVSMMILTLSNVKDAHMYFSESCGKAAGKSGQQRRLCTRFHQISRRSSAVVASSSFSARISSKLSRCESSIL